MSGIRIAKVSKIDYKTGKLSVVYTDRGHSVSKLIPCLAFEYNMPKVGDTVAVAMVENANDGTGIVLGKIWGGGQVPPESGSGIYRKDFAVDCTAFIRYDEQTKTLTFHADTIKLEGYKP